jgi:hypothetical protein
LRNSINDEDKKKSLSKLEDILSIVRDMEDRDVKHKSKRNIKEDENMGQGEVQGCTSLKGCVGKTFKANSLDRLSELYQFIVMINSTIKYGFKQVNYGATTYYPPAPAPTNSPYDPGTKVAWEFLNPDDSRFKVNISQMNECIKSCPQILVRTSFGFEGKGQYSILDDNDFENLKLDLKTMYSKARAAGRY